MRNKKYALILGLIASLCFASFAYAWTYSTHVANGDVIPAATPSGTWCGLATRVASAAACNGGAYTSVATCDGDAVTWYLCKKPVKEGKTSTQTEAQKHKAAGLTS